MDEIIGLFPTPFLRATALLPQALVDGLVAHFSSRAERDNNASANLSHTRMLKPGDSPLLVQAAALITPKLADFGALLFGEALGWSLKEMWVNVLDTGGRQAMHNHANSFVSGVVYLTPTHPQSQTVFMKSPGGTDFIFRNDHAATAPGPYSADKWVSPAPQPGDMVLFPSYLMHAVPPNPGERRITLSFNAIPSRLDSWGYAIGFSGLNAQPAEPAALPTAAAAGGGSGGARRLAATALMVASGFAGLGWQIVWTQQCAVWLGHESAAVLAVLTAFFGGLALGAALLGPRIERSRRPARWYAACEAAIAAWGLVLVWLMAPVGSWLLGVTGVQPAPAWQWAVAFGGTLLLLLPATAAMGATLPAMARVAAQLHGRRAAPIAGLYAANTLGAVAGVLAAAFWLVPAAGLTATAAVCIALNALCAAATLLVFAAPAAAPAAGAAAAGAAAGPAHAAGAAPAAAGPAAAARGAPAAATAPVAAPAAAGGGRPLLALLALTGLLGIGDEVLVVRVLSQVTENTVYTFAVLLAVYLCGSAAGAAAYQRWWRRRGGGGRPPIGIDNGTGPGPGPGHPTDVDPVRNRLVIALAAACLLGTAGLWFAEAVRDAVLAALQPRSAPAAAGIAPAIAAEAALALAAFGLPTVLMGALFSHLAARAAAAGVGFGRALAANTLGAAAAPLLFGVLLLPALGAKAALLLLAAAYLALLRPRAWAAPAAWLPAAAALALALWAPPLAFVDVPAGGRVVSHVDGTLAAVSVVEDAGGVARLFINNRQQEGSSATLLVDGRQALLPLLLHPAPRRALFLGLGTGVTASTATLVPGVQAVDAVELLPEVIEASRRFTPAVTGSDAAAAGRLHVVAADARRFVRAGTVRYDVIVSDNFHPARSGSAALYTVEHFAAVRERLAAGGLFCQWLPLHQLDLLTLRSIVRSFSTVYPGGWALLASNSLQTPVIGLVGNADGSRIDAALTAARLDAAAPSLPLSAFGIDDVYALLGSFFAGPRSLLAFADGAAPNTDDHPVVAYSAPRTAYAADTLPADRLLALLRATSLQPAELITAPAAAGTGAQLPSRLAAYWRARDAFLDAGRAVRPSADVRQMLAQVRGPLLAALATSPDFRPAYDPLLRMAAVLARSDADAARALLTALQAAQPARPEAGAALAALATLPRNTP